jgi:hypothetical protein
MLAAVIIVIMTQKLQVVYNGEANCFLSYILACGSN